MTTIMADQIHAELPRAPTMMIDDEDDFGDNEEFIPSAIATPSLEEDSVKIQFDSDIADAQKLSQKEFADAASRNRKRMAFVISRQSEWEKTTYNGRNFLHYLAYYNYNCKPFISLQWLMARAIYKLPHLMGAMDKSKRTPLTVALSVGNEMFCHAACKNQKVETLQKYRFALTSECKNHDNELEITCLHTALICSFVKEESREDLVKVMCTFVPKKMFIVTDIKGRTPLHLAVEYERCCKTQVGIVNELLHWGPEALEVKISIYSHRPMSVYQFYEGSRKQGESRKKLNSDDVKIITQTTKREEKDTNTRSGNPKETPKKAGSKIEKGNMERPPSRDGTETEGPILKRRDSSQSPATPQDGEIPAFTLHRKQTGSSTVEGERLVSTDNAIGLLHEKNEGQEQAAKIIGEQLKLIYLRTQRPDRISHCLHIQDEQERELWFDFGPPKKFTKTDFRKHFGHLRFDSALQYVAFPQVELDEGEDDPDVRHQGRKDMVFFFDWLRQKGVKRIVKVIVDDLKAPSHSDQAIEEALMPFHVEILDWRRSDLDPVSLERVGKCLREIHLQWSGRNPVLRSWSEKDGLSRIPTLETITITQFEGLESSMRIRDNLDEFERRLYDSWPADKPKPRIKRPKATGGRLLTRTQPAEMHPDQSQGRSVDPHRWMQCMEEFASHFRQIRALRDKDPLLGPVVVALIDDGADITHPDLKGMKISGKSFHHYLEGSTWRVSPYWDSSSGHGTLMARLIHRVCPSAIIHVIKLQTFIGEGSAKLQINPDSAIQAIEYAADQGAEIMSMSWTIKPAEDPAKRKAFDDAIHNALNSKKILMFCAASDQGKSADLTYPHGSNPNSFRIGAAKATGSMSDAVGDAHKLSFIFPGHEVVVIDRAYEDVHDKNFQKFEAHSGSSVANALAAGLAALVIECVRLGVFYTNETRQLDPTVAIRVSDLVKICRREQMQYAFTAIGTNRNTDHMYIEVWNTFSAAADSLKQNEGARISQLEVIAGLARLFLRKVG